MGSVGGGLWHRPFLARGGQRNQVMKEGNDESRSIIGGYDTRFSD